MEESKKERRRRLARELHARKKDNPEYQETRRLARARYKAKHKERLLKEERERHQKNLSNPEYVKKKKTSDRNFYKRNKDAPVYRKKKSEQCKKYYEKRKSDPIRHEEHKRRLREYYAHHTHKIFIRMGKMNEWNEYYEKIKYSSNFMELRNEILNKWIKEHRKKSNARRKDYYNKVKTTSDYKEKRYLQYQKKYSSLDKYFRIIASHKKSGYKYLKNKGKDAERKKFDLTAEDLMRIFEKQQGKCFYTNLPLTLEKHKITSISLDRFDNNKSYTIDNTVICSRVINSMKRDNPYEEIIKIIKAAVNHSKNIKLIEQKI